MKILQNTTFPKNRERDYLVTEPKIQPIDTQPLITIQNGNCQESSQLAKINQLSFFDSFNYVDKVAVSGNNARQERRKLLATVLQHHTIVDVFYAYHLPIYLLWVNCALPLP